MQAEVTYSYVLKETVLLRTFFGKVTKDVILLSWDHIYENNMLNDDIVGIISDYRQSSMELSTEDLDQLEQHYELHSENLKNKKLGQVVDSPDVAIPFLYQHRNKSLKTKPFSTLEAALDWMNS